VNGNQSTGTTDHKAMFNGNVSWVKGNHSYKVGADFRIEQYPRTSLQAAMANTPLGRNRAASSPRFYDFAGQHRLPFADFLMGNVSTVTSPCPQL
jgi:hypothetical protein